MLLGCYRTGDANDPEVYITASVRVLSAYPLDIVHRVVDPVTGLPSKSKWLPTVSEIRDACQEIHGLHERARAWDEGAARQVAERVKLEKERAARPSAEDLRAKHGATYGLDPDLGKPEQHNVAGDRLVAFSETMLLREYERLGVAPVYSGNTLVSPTLLQRVQR